ncbi:MAG: ATP-binding protein [Alphaproteobacteria bacterium]
MTNRKNTIQKSDKVWRAGFPACLVYVFLLILLSPPHSFAQNNTNTLILDNSASVTSIAPFSYITTDHDRILSPESLVSRHKSNLRGQHITSDVINLGLNDAPSWILFSVKNTTNNDDWVLHFGNTLDGRMGVAKKIYVMNYSTRQTMTYPMEDEKDQNQPQLLGAALPIKVTPGGQNIFVIYAESQNGLPLMLAPKIMSQDTYMRIMLDGDASNFLAAALFIGIIAFFAASFYITRHYTSIALISYYTLLSAVFFNLDVNFVASGIINGSTLLVLYIISFIPLFIAAKFFNHITHDYRPMENMALAVLVIFILAISSLYLSILGLSIAGFSALTSTVCFSLVALCVIFAFTSRKPVPVTSLFVLALFLSPAAFAILALSAFNILPASSFTLTLFWALLIPQGVCFIAAYIKSNTYRKERKKQENLQRTHDEQSLARLQKSKDSADQARLLRVIERERELMSELREREVKRTEEMRKAKDMADKANKDKSAFLAVVSHEIRTPMNGILGMVQLLQNTDMTKSQGDYVDTIRKSGDTMMALLNDILDFEKIEKGAMELESVPINLRQLAQDIVMLMSGHAAQKNVELRANIADDVPTFVLGDPTRLRQIFLNLVNNGLKFTEKGHVIIGIKKENQTDESPLLFFVEDTGIGISEKAQEKLFTPFTQAETSTSRKYGGTGLGLAISNRLIEAMGGKIEINSQEGRGSTFSFTLSLQADERSANTSSAQKGSSEQQGETRSMTILVVEDNEMNRKVLEGFLIQKGHTLLMATNGLEALDICKAQKPELILMDIQMDGLSGIETTKKLRALPDQEIASTPVIALTGNVMLEDIESFFSIGMNGFIAKPINADTLYDTVHNASLGKFEHELPDGFFDKDSQQADQASAPETQAPPINSPSIDLQHVEVSLELDDREHFVSDSEITTSPKITDSISITDIRQPKTPIASLAKAPPVEITPKTPSTPIISGIKAPPPQPEKQNINKPTDEKPAQNINVHKDKGELTEIQKYLMEQHSSSKVEDTSSAPESTQPSPSENVSVEEWLDLAMLDSLKSSLGGDQFTELLKGFSDKAKEIIDDLDEIIQDNNTLSLGARGHELKGMAGNFGMKKVSDIAGEIEKAAKTQQAEEAIEQAKKLKAAYDKTQAAFEIWLQDNG